MSTRRARIKAVAALPPRRKNADIGDGSKNKPNPSKEPLEKELRSPKTPRSYVGKNEEKSPTVKSTPLTPPPVISNAPAVSKTPISSENELSPMIESLSKVNTPTKVTDKVPVITSTTRVKPTPNLFASPPVRKSPHRRNVDSPVVVRSPKSVGSSDNIWKISDMNRNNGVQNLVNHTPENASKTLSNIEKNSDLQDDYSVPSVPESSTEETIIDGIVPLQSVNKTPKLIDLLKNEIISEYAEVLFDPIVPLPSPSKVRPKLRPVPRLAPHRRNSVQGSASESEDETRRALLSGGAPTPAPPPRQRHDSHTSHNTQQLTILNREVNRVRNDSVCSTVSQATVQPPPATSPVKEKHFAKAARRQEMGKRMWRRRRRETVKRDALTMYDLIFYNPTTNPIVPDQDEIQAKEENAKDEAERMAKTRESEEDVDDPPTPDAAPVPQIKLGPNGEIILDEKSLVIKQSDANRKVSSIVREGAWGGAAGGRYTRAARTADWSAAETVRFYRALAAVGTDFSLMAQLFPDRTRRDLKLKFKKEEKLNGGQVDKALRSATSWDVIGLQDEFREEREDAAMRAEKDRQRLQAQKKAERERMRASREMRMRPSKGFKALELTNEPDTSFKEMTADDFVNRHIETRALRKQRQKRSTPLDPKTLPPQPIEVPNTVRAHPHFATLTLINKNQSAHQNSSSTNDLATISRVDPKTPNTNPSSAVPSNIETGSLVVLRVNDPNSPSKTMLQTYIAHGAGKLTPVALPSTFLNSVVGYMKLGTPKGTIQTSSPQLPSPNTGSQDRSGNPSVIQVNPSPAKRQRHSSYTITPL